MAREKTDVLVVIPVRLGSTRLPMKMLLKETGKYLFQHTYDQVKKSKLTTKIVIAVDDNKLFSAAKEFTDDVMMTSNLHQSGTDRAHEVVSQLDCSKVINVQGDEPEVNPEAVDLVADILANCGLVTLVSELAQDNYSNPNVVKAVVNPYDMYAQDFVRTVASTIPEGLRLYRHIGMYGYSRKMLATFVGMSQTARELRERLEQLRFIDNGYAIRVGLVKSHGVGIDTMEDYRLFVERQAQSGQEAKASF
jgi:3-deoxy-manno-octulosonate cytidylyltransferase (CMP-KDO synthetase)